MLIFPGYMLYMHVFLENRFVNLGTYLFVALAGPLLLTDSGPNTRRILGSLPLGHDRMARADWFMGVLFLPILLALFQLVLFAFGEGIQPADGIAVTFVDCVASAGTFHLFMLYISTLRRKEWLNLLPAFLSPIGIIALISALPTDAEGLLTYRYFALVIGLTLAAVSCHQAGRVYKQYGPCVFRFWAERGFASVTPTLKVPWRIEGFVGPWREMFFWGIAFSVVLMVIFAPYLESGSGMLDDAYLIWTMIFYPLFFAGALTTGYHNSNRPFRSLPMSAATVVFFLTKFPLAFSLGFLIVAIPCFWATFATQTMGPLLVAYLCGIGMALIISGTSLRWPALPFLAQACLIGLMIMWMFKLAEVFVLPMEDELSLLNLSTTYEFPYVHVGIIAVLQIACGLALIYDAVTRECASYRYYPDFKRARKVWD